MEGGGGLGGVESCRDFYPAVFNQQEKPYRVCWFSTEHVAASAKLMFFVSIEDTAEEDSIVTLCLLRHKPLSKNVLR